MSFSGYLRNNFWYYTKLTDNFFRLFSLWLFPPYGDKDVRVHVEQAEKGQNSRCQCGVPYQGYGVPLYGQICCLLWEFPSKLVEEIESKKNNYWWSIAIEVLTRRWRLGPSWSGRRPPRWSRCAPWPWPPWTWAQGVELNCIELNWQIYFQNHLVELKWKKYLHLGHIKVNWKV